MNSTKALDDNARLQRGELLLDPEADVAEMPPDDTEPSVATASVAAATAGWEKPSSFDRLAVPNFPVSCLPSPIREFVTALAEATQVPLDMPGSLVLPAVAACIQHRVEVLVKPGYVEPISLYVAGVAEPGTRKSAVVSAITSPIRTWEQREEKRLQPVIELARVERETKEGRKAKLLHDAVKEEDSSARKEAMEEVGRLAVELAEDGPLPVYPRVLCDDVTPEKLASLLEEQGERIAVFSPEGGLFDMIAGRYSKGVPNLDVYLKGHAGDALRVDRKSGPPVKLDKPALTIGLAVQPDVLRALADKPGFRGRGLVARFLYSLPESLVGRRRADSPSVPGSTVEQYEICLWRLLEAESGASGEAIQLTIARDADDIRIAFTDRLEPRIGPRGDLYHMADWGSKAVGAAVRIAGALHAVKCAHAQTAIEGAVDGETMRAAVKIVEEYFLPHSQAAIAEMGADPAIDKARRVVAWLQSHDGADFSVRDLHQEIRGQGCFRTVRSVEETLELVEGHGYVRRLATQPRYGQGRPPSARYVINPLARGASQNPQKPQNIASQARLPNSEGSGDGGNGGSR